MSDEWTSEQVAEELRRARLARGEDPPRGRRLGPETGQEAAYRRDVQTGLQEFRGRVGVVTLIWMGLVGVTYFLFGRNLTGSAEKVYGGVLLVSLGGVLGWILWTMARHLIGLVRGYKAVKDGTNRVTESDGSAADGG